MNRMYKLYILFSIIILITQNAPAIGKNIPSPESLYSQGIKIVKKNNQNKNSIDIFRNIMLSYPFSEYAIKAQILTAYVQYNQGHYEDAEISLQNYINNYPNNKYTEYAYYLLALSGFRNAAVNSTDYDIITKAKASLEYVYNKNPNSKYTNDIKIRLNAVNNLLAERITGIGYFYFRYNKNYQATINRMLDVINYYKDTDQVPIALYYLTISYKNLNNNELYQKYAQELEMNHKESYWYSKLTKTEEKNFTKKQKEEKLNS